MSDPTAILDCTRTSEILVVALELSVKSWKIAAAPLADPSRPRLRGAEARDVTGLLDEIERARRNFASPKGSVAAKGAFWWS